MGRSSLHAWLLWCAATDATFERREVRGSAALVGKCIHCGKKLVLGMDGCPLSDASLEHIVPKTHGGTDSLDNLAVACRRCNVQKGYRHDHGRADDPKLRAVIETLRQRRAKRWREPLEGLVLPPLPS